MVPARSSHSANHCYFTATVLDFNDYRLNHSDNLDVETSQQQVLVEKDYLEANNLDYYFDPCHVYLVGFLHWIIGFVFQPSGRFWSFSFMWLIKEGLEENLYGLMSLDTTLRQDNWQKLKQTDYVPRLKIS